MRNGSARLWPLLLLAVVLVTGCTINRDIMFKTPLDYEFDTPPDSIDPQFKIQPNDYLQFRLFANDGFKMIDMVSSNSQDAVRNLNRITFNYLVEFDGTVKLPLLGHVPVAGMTLREAEIFLEQAYVEFYNRPYVQLTVTNRRVVVFPGGGGDAQVIPLENNNTTLMEVIAQAGGISKRGHAAHVKLFRKKSDGTRDVYEFDMSDIEGLRFADMVMQGDDIVYVEPNPELVRELLYDLNPIITLLTSAVLVLGIIRGFQ
ncbi:MAG: polysaccharide biosynthesis/export family protein [Flavobacteriales bacterium]|nr:polysaccharide biosynthesis/export family protein [Flavobacteriales bacterium]MCB9166478.1 polysaccharide biosynthesis/export family protein [Flavobacteriales bacterium]